MPDFPRQERLKEKILIAELFAKGKHISDFPIRLLFLESDSGRSAGLKVLFSVPKKKVRKAIDRNRIKRKMREVYRLHREEIFQSFMSNRKNLVLGLVFMGSANTSGKETESKIILTLRRLVQLNDKAI